MNQLETVLLVIGLVVVGGFLAAIGMPARDRDRDD